MAPESRRYLKGAAVTLAATLLWSLSGIFVRLTEAADLWQIAGWRAGSTALSLFVFLLIVHRRDVFRSFSAIEPAGFAVVAGVFAIGSSSYVISLTLTSVANVSFISGTAPIFAAILAYVFVHERTGALTWAAAVVALAGIGIIVLPDLGPGGMVGNILAIFVALTFAAQAVAMRRFRAGNLIPPICLGAAAIFLVMSVLSGFQPPNAHDLMVLALMGVVQLAVPIALFAYAVRHVPAVHLSLLALMDVVLNPLWVWIGVGERPSEAVFIGGPVILGAVVMAIIGAARSRGPTGI